MGRNCGAIAALCAGGFEAKRHGRTLGVLFFDLDEFKTVNDTYGYAAGDRVLIQTADRLRRMSRKEDTVSRRGGDEFLILLTELRDEADALTIAGKIVQSHRVFVRALTLP